jgi:hypothetical protein
MKMSWDFYSKRRNISLQDWIKHRNLPLTIEAINSELERSGFEHLSSERLNKVIKEMTPPAPVKKPPAKKQRAKKSVAKPKSKTS